MDETTKIWNKKLDDLTVGDSVILYLAAPIVMIGATVAATVAVNVIGNAMDKFRTRKCAKTELIDLT